MHGKHGVCGKRFMKRKLKVTQVSLYSVKWTIFRDEKELDVEPAILRRNYVSIDVFAKNTMEDFYNNSSPINL